uniref:Uncharacterized protein n=1 Tax=Solanum lycopersicum TaxID=4081 RepID=A0A3Q7ED64_SOLLC
MTKELKKFIYFTIILVFYFLSILSSYLERNFLILFILINSIYIIYYISVFNVPSISYVISINRNTSRNLQSTRIYSKRHVFYKIIFKLVTFLFQMVLR